MPSDSCSFLIGDNTLLEIEKQAKFGKSPVSSQKSDRKSVEIEIIEESPNSKENVSSFTQRNLQQRLKGASQRGRQRRKLEKSKSSPSFSRVEQSNFEISSISKYLRCDEDVDLSAWERSAAKLISPAVQIPLRHETPMPMKDLSYYENLRFDCSATQPGTGSKVCLLDNTLDTASNFEDISFKDTSEIDFESSNQNVDNVTFMQPHESNLNSCKETQQYIDEELVHQKSTIKSYLNESITSTSHNLTIQEPREDHSLKLDGTKNLRLISSWNLPASVVNEYRKKNVTEMFEWQSDCLKNPKVLFEGSNLVYSAPTSAGKTLVSEILMVKNIVERKKKALFILPFVSVVREKMFYLQDLMASSGIRVEGFFGGYHPPGGFESIDLAVCTIEKANSIINRLLEQDKLCDIGTIVIDEVHLISDSSRGYILELLLTKILYMCEKFKHKIQLITMSATLPNVDLLRKWLKAEYYHTDFRPVELREMIKINKDIFDQQMKLVKVVNQKYQKFFFNDTDEVCELAMETIMENCQLLIFCPSKDWCEKLCTNLARGIHNMMKEMPDKIEAIIEKQRLENLLEQAKGLPAGVDQILQRCLGYGCAFHHAGLTTDERDLIEMGFKDGTLKVLVATSTLSSGVNLPARRVIIRTPMFGKNMMSNLTYRQMIGRAGRKGKDILGESILVCNDATSKVGKQLVIAPLDPITSCLDVDNHAHLKRALLEIIASGVANTKRDLESFVNSTLFFQQHNVHFGYFELDLDLDAIKTSKTKPTPVEDINNKIVDEKDPIKSAMDFLLEYEFIRIHVDDEAGEIKFVPTRLGLACLSSSMPPKDGFLLFSELQKARQCFVLDTELHAIYLVTPFSVAYQLQDIDWIYFAEMHDKLPEAMKRVGEMVGVSATYMIKAITGKQGTDWRAQQIHKRFYTALALQELVNETSISEVSEKYKIHRGLLQNLQQMASTFAGIVTTFCKSLQWNQLALILAEFRERLFFGIHPDLIDLMKIPSMGSTRTARALYKSGIEKLNILANSTVLSVENVLMDLGGNFFVVGKSLEMSVPEVSKLLIDDARSHIQNEIGLKDVRWIQEPTSKEQANKSLQNANTGNARKRKADTLLNISDPIDEVTIHEESVKRKKSDHNKSIQYRKKLRSSGGPNDFIVVDSQLMNDLDKKAESGESTLETSDENASLFQDLNGASINSESINLQELMQQHLKIVDILASTDIFEIFIKEIADQKEIGMSVGIQKFEMQSQKIGGNVLRQSTSEVGNNYKFKFNENFYIDCISFCFNSNRICYLNLQKNNLLTEKLKSWLKLLMSRSDVTMVVYEAKEHLKVLQKALGTFNTTNVKILDPRLASWVMDPDTNLNWYELVNKFSPHHVPVLELATKHSTVSSLGLNHVSRVESKVRTAVECFLSMKMIQQQLEGLQNTGKGMLSRVFRDLEMPIQLVLLKMEFVGFPINEKKLQKMIEDSTLLARRLEQHIYELNGRKFNVSSSKEVAKVVGIHRNMEKKRISTAKNVLEKLDLPIANSIMIWRTLTTTISNIQPMMKLVKNGRIYGKSFSLTQTGRISMHEPNLQNVTKDFSVDFRGPNGETIKQDVSFRRVFECEKDKALLSADFCQLELRILTHLSKDVRLTKIMKSPGEDIFRKIAAKWNKVDESDVTDVQRNQTKQICYGIIYGMGNKALAETIKVDEETAKKLSNEFHATYPDLKRYSLKVVEKAREQGFVETVTCRRRYFPAMKSENSSERSQAERQALNTCIQGSASDLVKNAILRMERNLRKHNLEGCELVLHLHDELFYEVPKAKLDKVAKILIQSMENCVKLNVPLLVKLKFGSNWGEMKNFQ